MNVKEILQRRPPEILYHYTTQEGLLGIVKSQEIWASHTQYLNDEREFRHAIDLVKDELSRMERDPRLQDSMQFIAGMKSELELGIESINVFVCSFSEDGDVLSQWRAYSSGRSGFSVGFSGDFLRAVIDELQFWLVPVIYDEDKQRVFVRTLLNDLFEEARTQREPTAGSYAHDTRPGGNLVAYLNRYAPILKHRSFSEEREWRIISRPTSCWNEHYDVRPGTSMLIPYIRIPLSSDQRHFRIEEIVIGPTPHPIQSSESVLGLFEKHRVECKCTKLSRVPYRNW